MKNASLVAKLLAAVCCLWLPCTLWAGGERISLVAFEGGVGDFPIVSADGVAALCYDRNEYPGVVRAIGDLRDDVRRVTGRAPRLSTDDGGVCPVVIGTLGRNARVGELVERGLLRAADLEGRWESFVIAVVERPWPGVPRALVIAGSDKRGTIYGIYELSCQMGVSPWHWWADVPVSCHDELHAKGGTYYASGEPKVKYRGIFLNDEFPCLTAWAREKFGGLNSHMYARLFELLLRLRANTLWPAMWGSFKEHVPLEPVPKDDDGLWAGNCFNLDDPLNPRLADEYGIVVGTSHHEPMQRSQQEWIRTRGRYGNGEWNWLTNKAALKRFFREGIEAAKDYECLVTIGMRGDEDRPMTDAGSREANFRVMKDVIAEQRRIISRATGRAASQTPQVWTLYKEVQEYYEMGLPLPDDVIIMLCDDDWGHVRLLPPADPAKRHPGGYGMYYHANYYGAPRAGKWLTMSTVTEMWEQMQLAYAYGVDRLWMLNVGDLKPHEYVTDFFLEMAWNPDAFNARNLDDYARRFCALQFGEAQAAEAASILTAFGRYASRSTAEMLDADTYNLATGEWKTVRDEFLALEARALRQFLALPAPRRDAYQQLVLFPVQGLANLYDLYYSLAMNRRLAAEGDPEANAWADRVEACFARDSLLCHDYNRRMAGGKWNHMMDQVHIGYASWHAPQRNLMPGVARVAGGDDAPSRGYVYSERGGVVAMEAARPYRLVDAEEAVWTEIRGLGRARSGFALMPYTASTEGARVEYRMHAAISADSVDVHLTFAALMPFLPGGHSVAVALDGGTEVVVGINQDLTWENKYTTMYPTAASRIIRKRVRLASPHAPDGTHTLTYRPLQPGVVLQRIIVDCGGYEDTHLGMPENPYEKE